MGGRSWRSKTLWTILFSIGGLFLCILTYVLVTLPSPNIDDVSAKNLNRFEELATEMKVFPAGSLRCGGGSKLHDAPNAWADSWHKIYQELITKKRYLREFIELLKHVGPEKAHWPWRPCSGEDPKLMPHIAAMIPDRKDAANDLTPVPTKEPVLEEQTVGPWPPNL